MRRSFFKSFLLSTCMLSCLIASSTYGEGNDKQKEISRVMDSVIHPLMEEYGSRHGGRSNRRRRELRL